LHIAVRNWIEIGRPHDNRNGAARGNRGFHGQLRANGYDQIHLGARELGGVRTVACFVLRGGATFHHQISPIDETALAQFIPERRVTGRYHRQVGADSEKPDAVNSPCRVRARRERPRRRTSE
jgi:hypothetical protein